MNNRAWMVGLLIIMAIICSSSLALVNIKIAPIIRKNQEITAMSTVLGVFNVPFDSRNRDGIISLYNQRIEERVEQELTLFNEKESGATAVSFSGNGFQGAISLVVAVDGETITGFKIVSQQETPGLGARITEKSFQNSFIGKQVSGGVTMTKSGNAGPRQFDSITGATETSRALEKILNRGFKHYFQVVEGK